ncbi:uncharacterized protein FIESC28_10723 [Fusarium coffeatum]|uniref:Uncharacterized protein n=1 Tax=Fusarium coffeatum TaxID=231269 RepID=A0A366QQN7_9HYPO|nr:uncharacterized protein FIESC28_10723 [Fusarium coffeatum]RBR07224.1 hypothetical protein FIESC28_10723 [Fusarium coffeatum]
MDVPRAYDWREILARLGLSATADTPSTLDHAPTRRVLHANMLCLRNANGEHYKSKHKICFKHSPEKRREAQFVPFGIWRMMFFRRLAWVRMNETFPDGTSPDIAAALRIDLNGMPTTENMTPYVDDNGTHIFDGRHGNFIDMLLPIDEIFETLKSPTNQQWIEHAIQQDRIHLRNLEELRTILRGRMPEPSFRHTAFADALSALFNADGSPTTNNPFVFLHTLMDAREEIVADLAVLQDVLRTSSGVDRFLDLPDDHVARMERLAGVTTDETAQLHPRFKPTRDAWFAAALITQHPKRALWPNESFHRHTARGYLHEFIKHDLKPTELALAGLDLWI